MSRNIGKTKQRDRKIICTSDKPLHLDRKTRLTFYPTPDGIVNVLDEDGILRDVLDHAEVTESYRREKGLDKVISMSTINETERKLDIDENLASYDYILSIDTSYDTVNGERAAFTAYTFIDASLLKSEIDKAKLAIVGSLRTLAFEVNTEHWNATGICKPENLKYAELINRIEKHLLENNLPRKVAVIIDSDLGNIPAFNKRTLPIHGTFFLPNDFCIFYASSDVGDSIQNLLLKACDSTAKKSLAKYKKESTQ